MATLSLGDINTVVPISNRTVSLFVEIVRLLHR